MRLYEEPDDEDAWHDSEWYYNRLQRMIGYLDKRIHSIMVFLVIGSLIGFGVFLMVWLGMVSDYSVLQHRIEKLEQRK